MPHPTLLVLRVLARHRGPVAAGHLARETGIPRASLYRALADLRETGFVTHLPEEQQWMLGLAAFELGFAYSRQESLQRLGRPVVRRLVDEVQQNAHLAVLHGTDVLYLAEERAPRRPSLVTDVGVRIPAPWTASGLAVLAALPREQVRALFPDAGSFVASRGDHPHLAPDTPQALRRALVAVRADGIARERDTVTAGLASVSVAVADASGHPVAAVAVTFEHARTEPAEVTALEAAVRAAAEDVERRLR